LKNIKENDNDIQLTFKNVNNNVNNVNENKIDDRYKEYVIKEY
jgi:hypothetical protein